MDTTVRFGEEDGFDYEAGTETFRTRRCIVRQIRLSDLDALYGIYAEPGVTDHLEDLYPWDEEVAYTKTYIKMIYGFYGYGMWIVEEKKTGDVIGRVGFDDREIPDGNGGMRRILEFGYLISPKRQQKGFATEVCRSALRYLFRNFEEDVVTSLIEPDHDISIRFAEKLGFSCKGDVDLGKKRMLVYECTPENIKSAQKTNK